MRLTKKLHYIDREKGSSYDRGFSSDEDDRIFYDTAKSANAVLVTGNKKHYPDESFIMTPAEFLEHISVQ